MFDKIEINKGLLEFIESSPVSYQTVDTITKRLKNAGFCDICDSDFNESVKGRCAKIYSIRAGSSLIAMKFPENSEIRPKGFHMVCAHTDSPMFKIKENAEHTDANGYCKLNTEKYGGMIVNTWLDRPLSVAGRVVFENDGELNTRNVDLKQPLYIIPNVAIHMIRGLDEKPLSIQTDLQPIGGEGLYEMLAKEAGCKDVSDILGTDLYLYNVQNGCILGSDSQFVCSPRLDDLQCVYTALEAFLAADSDDYINVFGVFDNEEVGSLSRQGAASDFLKRILDMTSEALDLSAQEYVQMLDKSFMVSADNAHAVHPNHPEKADIVNRPKLNGGVVIKYHGGQRYTTDAYSGAFIKQICKNNRIPYQIYHNNSDIAGGSTLGNLIQANVSVKAADIGAAQLAMHSSYETAGAEDTLNMYKFMKLFYSI